MSAALMPSRATVLPALLVALVPLTAGLAVIDIRLAALPFAAGLMMALTVSPWARSLVLIIGGMLVLQSSQALDERKLLYLGASAYALLFALVAVARALPTLPRRWRVLLALCCGWLVVVLASYGSSAASGVPVQAWVRDVIPYALIGLAPFFAIDLGLVASERAVTRFVVVVGVLAAVGTAVLWLTLRGVSTLGVQYVLLPTASLPALALGTAVILAVRDRKWLLWWGGAAVFIIAAMLITGTRTNVVLLVGLIGLAGPASRGLLGTSRLVTVVVAGALSLAVLLPLLAGALVNRGDFLASRAAHLTRVLESGVAADQSGRERIHAYRVVGARISEHPLSGVGPGHPFPLPRGGFATSLDTPLVLGAKFGLAGAAVMLVLLAAFVVVARGSPRSSGPVPPLYAGGRSFLVTLLLLLPFGGPWEDKGLGFSLVLLFAGLLAVERRREESANAPPEPPAAVAPLPAQRRPELAVR